MPSKGDSWRQQGKSNQGEIGRLRDGPERSKPPGTSSSDNILERHQDFVVNKQKIMHDKAVDRLSKEYRRMRAKGMEHEAALKQLGDKLRQRETQISHDKLVDGQTELWVAACKANTIEQQITESQRPSIKNFVSSEGSKSQKIAELEKQLAVARSNVEKKKENLQGPIEEWQTIRLAQKIYNRDFTRRENSDS